MVCGGFRASGTGDSGGTENETGVDVVLRAVEKTKKYYIDNVIIASVYAQSSICQATNDISIWAGI